MSENILKPEELNEMWAKMLAHRSVVRQAMIDYAVKMGIDESEYWRNPFRDHFDKYDDQLLDLQKKLTDSAIDALINEHAPNVDVDKDDVLRKMVDALTSEESETTTYDKPLVFDSNWITKYVQKNYINNKNDVAYNQMLSDIIHMIGGYHLEKYGRDEFEKDGVIILPFYIAKWFREENRISFGTIELLRKFDNFVQVLLEGAGSFDVSPRIFAHHFNYWSMWRDGLPSDVLFKKTDAIGDNLPVDWFRPNKGRSEIAIHFKKPEDAALVADTIFNANKH